MYEELKEIKNARVEKKAESKEACLHALSDAHSHLDVMLGTENDCSLELGNASGFPATDDGVMAISIREKQLSYEGDILIEAEATMILTLGDEYYEAEIVASKRIYGDERVSIKVPTELNENGRMAVPVEMEYSPEADASGTLQPISEALLREFRNQIKLK
ncbi:COMM domain-containing protein [Vibrio parahaemolyticus]|uniref:hypothetical protein n=1 Tax=Vibrio parahaemolyticus TaxID=670 RepID=UPI00387AA2F2